MNTKGVHDFEEFIRERLERYEAPFKPDWKTMQRTLDAAKPGASGVGRNLKIITGIVLVSGLVLLGVYWINQKREASIDGALTKTPSSQFNVQPYNKDTQDDFSGKTQNDNTEKNRENSTAIISPERKNQGNINDFSFKTPLNKLPGIENEYIVEANGPVLDMLRRDYKGEKQLPAPVASFTSNITEGCVPLTVKFKLENQDVAMKYLWDFGDGFYSNEPNPYHIYRSTGQFNVSLTATSLINEKSGDLVMANMITVHDLPDLKFDWDNSYNRDDREIYFLDHSKNVMEWYWSFGDEEISRSQNPKHTYSTEGSYAVQLVGKSALGCYDTITSQIRIIGKNLANKFFAPNTFTPNGDGLNDEFKPVITGAVTMEYEISVFDRNGKLIFETTDINKPWDGRLKDGATEAFMGTYIWLVLLKDQYGQQEKLLGQVTLLR